MASAAGKRSSREKNQKLPDVEPEENEEAAEDEEEDGDEEDEDDGETYRYHPAHALGT
jgi:hypothetical protein